MIHAMLAHPAPVSGAVALLWAAVALLAVWGACRTPRGRHARHGANPRARGAARPYTVVEAVGLPTRSR